MGSPPPLEGIRVLDFSRVIAGPLCTQQLADLGADVIKVEHPVTGDEIRTRSPRGDRRGAMFLAFNRSKRSIAIDLTHPAGVDLARRLAAACDVVIENFRPGVMDRLGLGQAQLRAADPALIYVSISAYGSYGPFSSRPGPRPGPPGRVRDDVADGTDRRRPHPASAVDHRHLHRGPRHVGHLRRAARAATARPRRLHRPVPARHRHRRAGQHRHAVPDGRQRPRALRQPPRRRRADRPVRDGDRADLPRHGHGPPVRRLLPRHRSGRPDRRRAVHRAVRSHPQPRRAQGGDRAAR